MTDEYVLQQEFGDGVDHPVHRLEYCREAVRAEFPDTVGDEIDAPDAIRVAIRDDDGFVQVQHTLDSDADAQALRDAIELTDCEVAASAVAYRDDLGATEVLLCAVPREWVGDREFDFDAHVDEWERGEHVTTVRPTKAEARRALRVPLAMLLVGVILYAGGWHYYFNTLLVADSLNAYQSIAKDVIYVGLYVNPVIVLAYALAEVYPKVQAYRNARDG